MTRQSLLRQGSPLSSPTYQLRVINDPGQHRRFDELLHETGVGT